MSSFAAEVMSSLARENMTSAATDYKFFLVTQSTSSLATDVFSCKACLQHKTFLLLPQQTCLLSLIEIEWTQVLQRNKYVV